MALRATTWLVIFFAYSAHASESFSLGCIDSTARYQVANAGDKVSVQAAYSYGPNSIPLFSGLLSSADLPRIEKSAPIIR